MTYHGHYTSQFHHFTKCGGHNGWVVQLEGYGPGDVEGGSELSKDHVAQYLGAVIIILVGILDETEAVHIAYKGLATRSENN